MDEDFLVIQNSKREHREKNERRETFALFALSAQFALKVFKLDGAKSTYKPSIFVILWDNGYAHNKQPSSLITLDRYKTI
jgi:hypothetical protein